MGAGFFRGVNPSTYRKKYFLRQSMKVFMPDTDTSTVL